MSTQQQQLITVLLDHEFFQDNSDSVPSSIFSDELKEIYKTLYRAHKSYKRSISLDELEQLHLATKPHITTSAKHMVVLLFDGLRKVEPIGKDVAADVIRTAFRVDSGRKIAQYGLDVEEGKRTEVENLKTYLNNITGDFSAAKMPEPITTNMFELMDIEDSKKRWAFNLPTLANVCPGIGGGELGLVFARPELSKSMTCISLVAAPGGFLDQGARVLFICNEESAWRTMNRCAYSFLNVTKDEFKELPRAKQEELNARFNAAVANKLLMLDSGDMAEGIMSIADLERFAKRLNPDVIVLDQADKVAIDGVFESGTDRIRQLYIRIRNLAKRNDAAVLAVGQASADAENKTVLSLNMMENSKTGKGAECDLAIGIGMMAPSGDAGAPEDTTRFMTLAKNKISGKHPTLVYKIDTERNRMIV